MYWDIHENVSKELYHEYVIVSGIKAISYCVVYSMGLPSLKKIIFVVLKQEPMTMRYYYDIS